MGLAAGGVLGIKLVDKDDRVVAMDVARPRSDLLVVTASGHAKRTPLSEYPAQGRNGSGVIAVRLAKGTTLVGACVVHADDKIALVMADGSGRVMRAANAPRMSRATQGEQVVALKPKEQLIGVVRLFSDLTTDD